jgi:hypothetical protein
VDNFEVETMPVKKDDTITKNTVNEDFRKLVLDEDEDKKT